MNGGEGDYQSVGHGTVVTTTDTRLYYLCHAYLKGTGIYNGRQVVVQEMEMDKDNWLAVKTGSTGQAVQPLPFAGKHQFKEDSFYDDFSGDELKPQWTWNFPFADVHAESGKGSLLLTSGADKAKSRGAVLALRPRELNYWYETKIGRSGKGFKGLVMYGDEDNFVAWGVVNGGLQVRAFRDGTYSVLHEQALNADQISLRVEVRDGHLLSGSFSEDGKNWKTFDPVGLDASSLIRWDRVARPGLIHSGKSDDSGSEFFYFKMEGLTEAGDVE